MTPTALTPAARGKRSKRPPTEGHRRRVSRPTAPAAPRRVSGPARPATRRAPTAPARPRRIPTGARQPLGARAVAFVKSLPDHQLLDRVVRGRAWIPILGVLLAGIVAMQVEVLKLGAGIGRSIERGTQLQSRNELLRASVAELADDQRIERLAAGMGMVMPAPTAVSFLSLKPVGYVQRAASSIHAPDPTAFLATLPVANAGTDGSGSADTSGATDTSATTDASATTNASAATDTGSPAGTSGSSTTGG